MQGRLKNQTDTTTPYTEWTDTVVLPGVMYATTTGSFTYNDVTYPTMPGNSGFGYHGFMWMKGGVEYRFVKNFDENGYVTVDGTSLISDRAWDAIAISPPFVPPHDGWYEIDVRLGQGGGGVGPSDSDFITKIGCGIAWNTNGLTSVDFSNENNWSNWHPLLNGENDIYLRPFPLRTVEVSYATDANSAHIAMLRIGACLRGCSSSVRLYHSDDAETDAEWAASPSEELGTVGPDACEFTTAPFAGAGTTATLWRLAVVDEVGVSWCPVLTVSEDPAVEVVRSALTPLFVRLDATLAFAGRGHSAAAVSFAFGKETAGAYETVTNALPCGDSVSFLRTGLERGAIYEWKIRVENAAGKLAEATGSFTMPTDEGPGTGGTRTSLGQDEYVHVFSAENGGEFTFTAPSVPVLAEVLAVGGGGAGGVIGGGGGAGGFVLASNVVLYGSYRVEVGAGGAWPILDTPTYPLTGHYDGEDTFLESEDGAIVVLAHGGGGGGSASATSANGNDGGSGGGASGEVAAPGGKSLDGQGHPGGGFAEKAEGKSGGGGGAGQAGFPSSGNQCGAGGAGLPCSITGTNVWYAGGGGGGVPTDWWYGNKPGKGGQGGGGDGGDKLANDTGEPGKNGTDGLGGGGGGSSGNRGSGNRFRPGNGGSGVLVLRYTMTPLDDPMPRIRILDVEPQSDTTAILRWDIPFAGPGSSLCDVEAVWSEDLSKGSFTTLIDSQTAGPDHASLENLLPGRTYEVRLTARNGLEGGVASSETLRFTMPADGAMPQTFQPAQPVIGSFVCTDSISGPYADFSGALLQPGTGSGFEDCTLAVSFGTNSVLSTMEKRVAVAAPDADGKFAFRLEDIPLDTLVYATIEVSNDAGFIDRLGTMFRTYSDTTLEAPAASSEQLVVTFRDEVRKIGCGTTTAWFRWSADGGRTWEESSLGSFSLTDPTNGWTVVRTVPDFNREVLYEFVCSNSIAVNSATGTVVARDRSVYRWNPTKLQGDWDSPDSWLCDAESRVGYPTAGATADFSHMIVRVRVTMTNEDAAVHCLRIDPGDGSPAKDKDLVFVGKEGGAFSIDTFGDGDTVRMENSHLTFQSLKVQFPGEYTLDFGDNCMLSLLNGTEMRATLKSSNDDFTLELTGNSCLHSLNEFSFEGKNPRIFLSDCGFLETPVTVRFGSNADTAAQVFLSGRNPAMQAIQNNHGIGFSGMANVEISLPEEVYGEDYIRWNEDPQHERGWYCDEVGQRRAPIRTTDKDWTWPRFSAQMNIHIDSKSPGRSHGSDKDYLLLDFRASNFDASTGITDTNKVSVTGLREGEYAYWVWDENHPAEKNFHPSRLYVHIKSNPATVLLFR